MTKLVDISGDVELARAYVPAQGTAGTPNEWVVGDMPIRAEVTSVEFIPEAAVTGAATNNFALNLRNRGQADAGAVGIATTTFASGTNAAARRPLAVGLNATVANRYVNVNDVLTLERTVNGTGLASPAGMLIVRGRSR